ncbi:MAG: BrnT family toxin [Desulfococcaceae bacterium]
MLFEWDHNKSITNHEKHGIDFETAKNLWQDAHRVMIYAPHPIENSWILIGKHENRLWTAVYTLRDTAIRIISVRRSRLKEKKLYEKKSICQKQ